MQRLLTILYALLAATATMQSQQYRQLTDIPTVYVETENRRSITSKEQYINSTFIMVDGDSLLRLDSTLIRGRGNSSWWNSAKKPYRVKFAHKQKLLGKGFANAKSWTLLANHGDKTMLRNALTYDLGRFMGMKFCPAARFVDLYINGIYRGTYQISDQVQVHKRRIDISEADGWLLEVANENSRENPYLTTVRYGITYNIKSPQDDLLTAGKRNDISKWLQGFEAAVASAYFCDPERGYRAYIDEADFINWYVGAEITGNIDALYSIYMWKDGDEDKMHFGPLWDLDIGYDNSSERSLLRSLEAFLGLWNRPFEKMMQRLWQDPWFANACYQRLSELTEQGLQQYLLDQVDSLRNAIYLSQQKNYALWPINQKVYDFEKHNYHNTYDAYVADLKNFINVHIPYLQQEFGRRRQQTGIEPLAADGQKRKSAPVYDLSGRRLATAPDRPGLWVQQGRKVFVK
jgi:hypothetical protein